MKLNNAIAKRIDELKKSHNVTQYQLFINSGVPQTTLSTIQHRGSYIKINTLYDICEGFDITLQEFFNSPLFDRENISD